MELKSCDRHPDNFDSLRFFFIFLGAVVLSAVSSDHPAALASIWIAFALYALAHAILRPRDPIDLTIEDNVATFSAERFGAARVDRSDIDGFSVRGLVVIVHVRGAKMPLVVPRFYKMADDPTSYYRLARGRKSRGLSLERLPPPRGENAPRGKPQTVW